MQSDGKFLIRGEKFSDEYTEDAHEYFQTEGLGKGKKFSEMSFGEQELAIYLMVVQASKDREYAQAMVDGLNSLQGSVENEMRRYLP